MWQISNVPTAGLIDRYNILVFPVMLGDGKRIFSTTTMTEQRLTLTDSEHYSNGVVKIIYAVEH